MKKIYQGIKRYPFNLCIVAIVIILYFINNLFLKKYTSGIVQEFFICFFNDLMAPVFLLAYANILAITRNMRIVKLLYIELICLGSGCVWEFLAPVFKKGSVTDVLDLCCYLVGGILYWFIIHVRERKQKYVDDK